MNIQYLNLSEKETGSEISFCEEDSLSESQNFASLIKEFDVLDNDELL